VSGKAAAEGWLRAAAEAGASDCAFEPAADGSLAVVLRVDGMRDRVGAVAEEEARACIARLKALASVPAYIVDRDQDGRIDGAPFGVPGEIRAAFLPTVDGNRAHCRLPALGMLPRPDDLGLPAPVLTGLRAAFDAADGLVVICGPTGSGKSTTIHSLLREQAARRGDRHVLSIEDPVERRLEGVTQCELAEHRGWNAVQVLRGSLRHDPDLIAVAEVRDGDTAAACLRAALTGHVVCITLHAGRPLEAYRRLVDMGCEPRHLLPALRCIVAQRLLRARHADCGGEGCPGCRGGYIGRRVIADLLDVDPGARVALADGREPELGADMMDQAAELVARGATSEAERRRVLPIAPI